MNGFKQGVVSVWVFREKEDLAQAVAKILSLFPRS
jgi:hypothetical protein